MTNHHSATRHGRNDFEFSMELIFRILFQWGDANVAKQHLAMLYVSLERFAKENCRMHLRDECDRMNAQWYALQSHEEEPTYNCYGSYDITTRVALWEVAQIAWMQGWPGGSTQGEEAEWYDENGFPKDLVCQPYNQSVSQDALRPDPSQCNIWRSCLVINRHMPAISFSHPSSTNDHLIATKKQAERYCCIYFTKTHKHPLLSTIMSMERNDGQGHERRGHEWRDLTLDGHLARALMAAISDDMSQTEIIKTFCLRRVQKPEGPSVITLVRGCKVMITSNIAYQLGLATGTHGRVVRVIYEPGEAVGSFRAAVVVHVPGYSGTPFYASEPKRVPIVPKLSVKQGSNISRCQIPLLPCYTITQHKSSGLTFKEVCALKLHNNKRFKAG